MEYLPAHCPVHGAFPSGLTMVRTGSEGPENSIKHLQAFTHCPSCNRESIIVEEHLPLAQHITEWAASGGVTRKSVRKIQKILEEALEEV
ncbi:hypothetical protein R0K18_27035, partial [Pantoea sp. SIMBA_133]